MELSVVGITQASDFLVESEILHRVISGFNAKQLHGVTQFNEWTIEDVLIHLHFWNVAADLSATNENSFQKLMGRALPVIKVSGFRVLENEEVEPRGIELRQLWIDKVRDMAPRWLSMDPKRRLPWAGPSMSARSAITARQMETWAHGFEVFDLLGIEREETDRIKNIVTLGINTFGWTHQVHGLNQPETMPLVELILPSGELIYQGDHTVGSIKGTAVDFAAVVTQTRACDDTGLEINGDVATTWMAHAQCFAGPAVKPPESGARFR